MTVTSTTNSVTYIGDGVTRAFPFVWEGDSTMLRANLINSLGVSTATTDFSVVMTPAGSAIWNPGGTLTYPASALDPALPIGYSLQIYRFPPTLQLVELRNQGAFLPLEIEKALDRLTMRDQRLIALANQAILAVANAIQLPETGPWILGNAAARKGLFLLFDPVTGNPTLGNPSPGTLNGFWSTVVATTNQADAMRALANGPVLRFAVATIQNAPPGGPATNDQYLVGTAGSGTWAGHSNQIARWTGLAWTYLTPTSGYQVFVDNTDATWIYTGAAWVDASTTAPVVGEYETRAAAVAVTVPLATLVLRTAGYATSGDGGGATYKRRIGAPAHLAYFQDASGAYFEVIDEVITFEMLGAIGDGTVNDTTAVNAAAATGKNCRLLRGKNYRCTGQLTMGKFHGQKFFYEGGHYGSKMTVEYNGGIGCILVGDTAAQVNTVIFENFEISQANASVQFVFQARKLRQLQMRNMRLSNFYSGFSLGTATDAHYILELFDCEVGMRLTGCLYFIDIVNSFGQIDYANSYVEGPFTGGSIGLRVVNNVQATLDHIIFKGGYFGRFEYNMYINKRVTNVLIGYGLLMEGHTNTGIFVDSLASFENFQITGMTFGAGYVSSSAYYHIHVGIGQTTLGNDGLMITDCLFNLCKGQPAIEITCNSANRINGMFLSNLDFQYAQDSVDNTHSLITLNQINFGYVNNCIARCINGALRYTWFVSSTNSQANMILGPQFVAMGFVNATPATFRS